MFRNYLKIAWRNLGKNRVYSAINIFGLAIGMAACLVILIFVHYEHSFDQFHSKNIYRLNEVQKFEGMVSSQKVALSMFPMGPTLKKEFPEILNFTRIHWDTKVQMTNGERRLFLPQVFYVDSAFLDMFDFKLLRGNRKTVLLQPNSIVLTEEAAKNLFGAEDPIGKTITHYGGDTLSVRVTGVMENVPKNSQLQFDGLISFNSIYKPDWMTWWGGNWLDTYFELAPHTDPAQMEKKFPAYLKKYMAQNDGWKQYELFLLPFKEVHASSAEIGLDYVNYQKFDKKYTSLFSIIALIVLSIACVNFMNLSTARSAERAREVGIRKSVGAQRIQVAMQFIGESTLLALIALVLAIGLVELALPYASRLSQRDLHLPWLTNWRVLLSILSGAALVGLISGLYPAVYLSSFLPSRVLKGSVQTGKNKGRLRNVLVVSQFASAIFLMIATIFVVRQLRYMQQRDPGFIRDQVLTIPLDEITYRKYDLFKQQLRGSTLVSAVTASQDQLGSHLDQSGVEFRGDGPLRTLTSTRLIVDPDYLNLYHIALAYGRNFSDEKQANGREYIINESLARQLLKTDSSHDQISSLIGKHFGFDSLGYIVGIAKDFNFNSLHYKIETMFMFNQKSWGFNTVSVKINGEKANESLAFIQSIWKDLFPDHPFEYQFLDDHFKEMYQADDQVSKIVAILAALAIVISCLGLFGLASYSAEKRVKEIGIRKVMGASVQDLVALLSKHFLMLVLLANLIAWPLVYLTLHRVFEDYAYHVSISLWVFALAGLASVTIALATVSIQAIKTALSNPVKSLRTE
jgi:putative ABC transport system permease protein